MSEILNKYNLLASQNDVFNVVTTKLRDGKWTKTPSVTFSKSYKSMRINSLIDGQGIGIFTGIHTHQSEGVILIDIDVYEDSDEARQLAIDIYNGLIKLFPELAFTSQTSTPSGGYHFYVKVTENIKGYNSQPSIKLFFEDDRKPIVLPIDIKADGGFAVIAPSPYRSAGKKWKEQYELDDEGKERCYEEMIELDKDNLQYASDSLLFYIRGKKSLRISYDSDNCAKLSIWEDINAEDDFKPAKSTSSESDDELNTITDTEEVPVKAEEEYIGFIRNADCLKEVVKQLQEDNLSHYDPWRDSMFALVHVFGKPFGGEVSLKDFTDIINAHCSKFGTSYDEDKNYDLIRGFWSAVADKMFGYGKLVDMITKNLGGKEQYNKWCVELHKKGLYKFKEIKDTGKFKHLGHINNIDEDSTAADVKEFFKSCVRYIADGSSTVVVRQLTYDIQRTTPGLRYVKQSELDRFIQWELMPMPEFERMLIKHRITMTKNEVEKTYTLKQLFDLPSFRKDIAYSSTMFEPMCQYLDETKNAENERLSEQLEMFDAFNIANPFRARQTYTREQALEHPAVELLNYHLREVLSNGNMQIYKYLTGVLAHMCQYPSVPTQVMCIFRDVGSGGNGKSLFAGQIGAGIFGGLYKGYPNAGDYQQKFETIRSNKTFVWIDELSAENVDIVKLKTAITMGTTDVQRKGKDIQQKKNYNNVWAACNDIKVLNIKPKETRRYFISDVNQTIAQDKAYTDRLAAIDQDGFDAYFSYLLSVNIKDDTNFIVGKGFSTEALVESTAATICSVDAFFIDVLQNEFKSESNNCKVLTKTETVNGKPKSVVTGFHFHNSALYEKYCMHIAKSGKHALSSLNFNGKLTKLFGKATRIRLLGTQGILGYKLTVEQIDGAVKNSVGAEIYERLMNFKDEEPEPLKANNNADLIEELNNTANDNIVSEPETEIVDDLSEEWDNQ